MFRVSRPVHGFLTFVLALAILAVAASAGMAEEQAPMVMAVAVEGNKLVPAEEILAAVKATQIGTPLSLEAVKADQNAVANLGYFAEVLPPEFPKMLGGVKVVFRVVEFPALKEIRIAGLTKMPLPEALAVFTIKPGQIINRNTMAADMRKLIEKAQKEYGLVLKSPVQRITTEGVIEIELIEMRLRKLVVVGLEKTKENVVLREITARKGEVFDARAFARDLQTLFMLGFFESIKPRIIFDTGAPDLMDIELEIKERKTGMFQIGVTYSTKDGELAGLLKVGDTNFFGTGNSISANLEINPDKQNIDLSYAIPWLDANHTSLRLRAYYNFDGSLPALDSDDLLNPQKLAEETLMGFEVGLGRPIGKKLTVWIGGKYQSLDRQAIENWSDPATFPSTAPEVTEGEIVTDSVSLQLEYKDLKPVEGLKYVYIADGLRGKLGLEFAGGFLGGDTEYKKYTLEGAYFNSITKNGVLALRLMGGFVDVANDPYGTADFVLGGAETLRGYDYQSFRTTEMVLLNAEYRHRFTETIEGVVFCDYGYFLGETDWEQAGGYGVGVRIWVPFLGQLRLDYGWPIEGGGGEFYFALGEVF